MRLCVLAALSVLLASEDAGFASALDEDTDSFASCMAGQVAPKAERCTTDTDKVEKALQICWYPLHHVQLDIVGETYSVEDADAAVKRLTEQHSARLLARLASVTKAESCR